MGKWTISMAIFNSYVGLPEGITWLNLSVKRNWVVWNCGEQKKISDGWHLIFSKLATNFGAKFASISRSINNCFNSVIISHIGCISFYPYRILWLKYKKGPKKFRRSENYHDSRSRRELTIYTRPGKQTVCDIENADLQLIFPLKMVSFHSFLYVYQMVTYLIIHNLPHHHHHQYLYW